MKISEISLAIEQIAPLKLAQSWDNVGLLIGNPKRQIKKILMTIDITKDVLAEARQFKADMILAYHPTIWDGLKKVTAGGEGDIVYQLIRADIAVFVIHTALDAAVGGVNDGLAELVGITDAKPIGDYVANPAGDRYKLVMFVPKDSLDKVSGAIFKAGAGHIGNYSNCGFGGQGMGSFKPLAGAHPAIGDIGRKEYVEEVRFETIVPAHLLGEVVGAMKNAHPYEEPAFDVFKISDTEKFGLGRMGELPKPLTVKQIVAAIKRKTGAKAVGIVGNANRKVKTAAVCAGSCGKIINSVIAAKCDLYVTGELKHHQAMAAQEAGLCCLCLSHSVSERFILKKLAQRLQKFIKTVTIKVSSKDADPFAWKNI
ncbi:MAG: Nif3-like dinuclear metal center hexameric protein [Sedimentisphaerales bacterium]|nr:Nif3-like dinuclear metal center hexameric protein [Sedimentisphaerales bacterium]